MENEVGTRTLQTGRVRTCSELAPSRSQVLRPPRPSCRSNGGIPDFREPGPSTNRHLRSSDETPGARRAPGLASPLPHSTAAFRLPSLALICFLIAAPALAESVRLAWDPVPQYWIAGYHVYRAPQETGPWEQVTSEPIAETFYMDETVEPGSVWYYAVTAVNTAGRESPRSTSLRVEVPSPRLEVSLGADRDAVSGDVVILSALVRGSSAGLTYEWQQTAGPAVPTVAPSAGVLVLTAPETSQPETLEFRLVVRSPSGASAQSAVRIRVLPRR